MPRLFVTRRIPDTFLAPLENLDVEVEMRRGDDAIPHSELLERATGCAALITFFSDPVDEDLLAAVGSELQVVANYAVGYENIDVAACTRRGVAVANTPGVLTDATADFTWALILAVGRRVVEAHQLVTAGTWQGWQPLALLGMELRGKTLGVVGLGRIGRAVAERARGFGMDLCYHNRQRDLDAEQILGIRYCQDLPDLLQASDVVSLHTPLTPSTHHLIGAAELRHMKDTALLINTSRGPVLDERALVSALEQGQIRGAGVDVFEREPAVHPGLLELGNVVLAPHLGSSTVEAREAMARLCGEAVAAVLLGRTIPQLLNPEVVTR